MFSIPAESTGKRIFLIASVLLLLVMPLLSTQYGQSGDEWIQMEYGRDIWNYFLNGDKQALDYDASGLEHQKMQYYTGTYDFIIEGLHRVFSFIPILMLRHFINALLGAIMMIFTGLLTVRLSKSWYTGLFALLFIVLSPRIFGESMNNPKDIPFACGFVVCIYGLLAFVQEYPRRSRLNIFLVFAGFALAFAVRSAGAFLLIGIIVAFPVWYYWRSTEGKGLIATDRKNLKRIGLYLAGALLLGYCIGLVGWPWALQSPIAHPLQALKEMANRTIYIQVLFEGQYFTSSKLPWYYELKWMLISTPVIILGLVAVFLAHAGHGIKRYGIFPVSLVLFCAFFPLVYIIFNKSNVYDSWRHVFFVYPFWIVLAALAVQMLQERFASRPQIRYGVTVVITLGLLPAAWWMVKSHPNQYVYFNELEGGIGDAYGYYETDYYQNTSRQAAEWLKANMKQKQGSKTIVLTNMTGLENYFPDTNNISFRQALYQERHFKDHDYFVATSRYIPAAQLQNRKWPARNAVHTITVNDVPLCTILENKDRSGIAAYNAFQQKDYATADSLYAQYLRSDSLDEYVYVNYSLALGYTGKTDLALQQINKAIALTPTNASYYDVLAAIYEAQGNQAGMQQAINRSNEIKQDMADE